MADISIVLQPNPFASRLERFALEAGSSVDQVLCEIVWRYHLDPAQLRTADVVIGEMKIPKHMWSGTRPKAGAQVFVKVMPADDIGSILVTAIGMVAAFYVPGSLPLFGIKGLGTALIRAGICHACPIPPASRTAP